MERAQVCDANGQALLSHHLAATSPPPSFCLSFLNLRQEDWPRWPQRLFRSSPWVSWFFWVRQLRY